MGAVAVLSSRLSTQSLGRLLDTKPNVMDQTLNDLHAILEVPDDPTDPLRLHHPSFRDFLLDKKRCEDLHLGITEKQAHENLATNCVRLMRDSLKQDILDVDRPGALWADESSRVEQSLSPELQYACLNWIHHLHKGGPQLLDDQVNQFLQEHLLHWLEALGWMMKVSEGISAIVSLESMASRLLLENSN
ncbi:hypothetical protein BKA61DRAFT_674085 [Leptodontidium sp. MPI-SDFR-AT-0119]|nr:hypothetical protein BKA61DRAFT_674085 [Leptodontidium sp. MPI-SDFR-AT-0119]